MTASDWRAEIGRAVAAEWPELEPRWVEAQIHAESAGVASATSICGALGLMQLMPATARELGVNAYDPAENILGGVRYLRKQYEHLPEIPSELDRLCWSWAAYNAGRGYVNVALVLAKQDTPDWWRWDVGRHWLFHYACTVGGRRCDYRQVHAYVARILAYQEA